MPKEWHDWFAINNMNADDDTKHFYRSIVAEKKPYFMCYIYPDLMKEYRDYSNSVNRIAMQKFNKSIDEINKTPLEQLTEEEVSYAQYAKSKLPVGIGDCVMNKICRRFEEEFDGCIKAARTKNDYDCENLKSGANILYDRYRFATLKNIYVDYVKNIQCKVLSKSNQRRNQSEWADYIRLAKEDFAHACDIVCSNEVELTDMLIDICYSKTYSKDLVWSSRGSQIVNNLLSKNGGKISIPIADPDGDIVFCGKTFKIITKEVDIV